MKTPPSFDQINNAFRYDKETGLIYWKDRPNAYSRTNNNFKGKVAGSLHVEGYWKLNITIDGIRYDLRAHRVAWILMTGEWPRHEIDHRDGARSNNKWSNLRECTDSQNGANRSVKSKSGLMGVYQCRKTGSWRANIRHNKIGKSLGTFKTKEEAYAAYCSEAEKLHGEFSIHISRG